MYAVIDLGSNSFHLLIAELKDQHISVVGRCSEKIQLAEGLNQSGQLSDAAMERGLACLQNFKSILDDHSIQALKIIGTEAMRRASNTSDFTQQAKKLGFDIDVISGKQEASWIFSGVCGPLSDADTLSRLTIDIGGASTELALGCFHADNRKPELQLTESTSLGCVSWRDTYFSPILDYKTNHKIAKAAAREALHPVLKKLKKMKWDEAYASSGSAKMLSTIGYVNEWSDGAITKDCINKIEKKLKKIKTIEEIDIPGLKKQRLDLLAPGLVIMSTIMDELGLEQIFYSPTALREGILAEMINRRVDYKLKNSA